MDEHDTTFTRDQETRIADLAAAAAQAAIDHRVAKHYSFYHHDPDALITGRSLEYLQKTGVWGVLMVVLSILMGVLIGLHL